MKAISVFGIGKLGLPLAAAAANKGYQVIGVDTNQAIIDAVNAGKSPYYEPGLAELVAKVHPNLKATMDYGEAVRNSSVSFIVVPTPSEPDGSFSTKFVESVVEKLGKELKNKSEFHVITLDSTVLPGCTERVLKQALEKETGKKCGVDFGVCYSPEFIALGSVIRDFTNPDVVLIGESDEKTGSILEAIYRDVCANNPPIVRTTIQNAELAKISLNAYVTMKISFANTLAEMAEKLPGGDADVISKMLGFDSRIGRKYLSGSLAFGGPCFPRDNKAFASVARRLGTQANLAETTDVVNRKQIERIVRLVEQSVGSLKNKEIAVLGLTYKANTDVIEEAAPVKIARELLEKGAKLTVYDPAGMNNARKVLGEKGVRYAGSAKECLKNTEFCLVSTPWDEFKSFTPADFTGAMKKARLLDCWRLYNKPEFKQNIEYYAIGLAHG
ncbi:MAG TPA: nucleotide sugar dehydrogenase [Dehalococcoidales bacterium]|nr:nucleotide sugar dehydrogenase [Dehalococcoidales bacterium]